jgi:hypothetical protein
MASAARAMVMRVVGNVGGGDATRLAGDEEGKGEGSKGNSNGNEGSG